VRELDECFNAFDAIVAKHGVEKIKTIGDAYMAVGGLPVPNSTHPDDVVQAALEMRALIAERWRSVGPYLGMRIGVHTGPVTAGIVGKKEIPIRRLGRHGEHSRTHEVIRRGSAR